jgi:hypothetical protein
LFLYASDVEFEGPGGSGMTAELVPSGNIVDETSIDLHTFAKSFIAGLVSRDRLAVRPHSPTDRRGFANVVRFLDNKIEQLEKAHESPRAIRQLVRVANELRPSNTGGYEGFEAALRSLQLTFASCPNPFYEEIAFSVPKPYAEATVMNLPKFQRQLVNEAADAFLQGVGE